MKADVGGKFPQVDPGVYPGSLVSVVDIGTQTKSKYVNRIIVLTFELDATIEVDGEQRQVTIDRWVNRKLTEGSKLREIMDSWNGKPFDDDEAAEIDLEDWVGKSAMLVVGHNKKEKAEITSVSPNKKQYKAKSDMYVFDLNDDNPAALEKVPEYLLKRMQESVEYEAWVERNGEIDGFEDESL